MILFVHFGEEVFLRFVFLCEVKIFCDFHVALPWGSEPCRSMNIQTAVCAWLTSGSYKRGYRLKFSWHLIRRTQSTVIQGPLSWTCHQWGLSKRSVYRKPCSNDQVCFQSGSNSFLGLSKLFFNTFYLENPYLNLKCNFTLWYMLEIALKTFYIRSTCCTAKWQSIHPLQGKLVLHSTILTTFITSELYTKGKGGLLFTSVSECSCVLSF